MLLLCCNKLQPGAEYQAVPAGFVLRHRSCPLLFSGPSARPRRRFHIRNQNFVVRFPILQYFCVIIFPLLQTIIILFKKDFLPKPLTFQLSPKLLLSSCPCPPWGRTFPKPWHHQLHLSVPGSSWPELPGWAMSAAGTFWVIAQVLFVPWYLCTSPTPSPNTMLVEGTSPAFAQEGGGCPCYDKRAVFSHQGWEQNITATDLHWHFQQWPPGLRGTKPAYLGPTVCKQLSMGKKIKRELRLCCRRQGGKHSTQQLVPSFPTSLCPGRDSTIRELPSAASCFLLPWIHLLLQGKGCYF